MFLDLYDFVSTFLQWSFGTRWGTLWTHHYHRATQKHKEQTTMDAKMHVAVLEKQ